MQPCHEVHQLMHRNMFDAFISWLFPKMYKTPLRNLQYLATCVDCYWEGLSQKKFIKRQKESLTFCFVQFPSNRRSNSIMDNIFLSSVVQPSFYGDVFLIQFPQQVSELTGLWIEVGEVRCRNSEVLCQGILLSCHCIVVSCQCGQLQ